MRQPRIDLADDTFIVAAPQDVADWLKDPRMWRQCWPDLALTCYHDRDAEGARWHVQGALVGTAEAWLEPFRDGVIVHVFLRGDPPVSADAAVPDVERYRKACKAMLFWLKDYLEQGREVGCSRRSVRQSVSGTAGRVG